MSLLELFCQPEMESLIRKKVPDVHKMVFYNMPRSTCKILILLQKLVPFCYVSVYSESYLPIFPESKTV